MVELLFEDDHFFSLRFHAHAAFAGALATFCIAIQAAQLFDQLTTDVFTEALGDFGDHLAAVKDDAAALAGEQFDILAFAHGAERGFHLVGARADQVEFTNEFEAQGVRDRVGVVDRVGFLTELDIVDRAEQHVVRAGVLALFDALDDVVELFGVFGTTFTDELIPEIIERNYNPVVSGQMGPTILESY